MCRSSVEGDRAVDESAVNTETFVGTWGLVSIVVDGKPFPVDPRIRRFLEPEVAAWIALEPSGRIEGQLPCNSISGQYATNGSTVHLADVVQTAAGCIFEGGGDQDLYMITEGKLMPVFSVSNIEAILEDGGNTLRLEGAHTSLTFHRISEPPATP